MPELVIASCKMDVRYYPWDEQTCYLKFGSWTYDYAAIDLASETDIGYMGNYVAGDEWELIEYTLQRNLVYYPCCEIPFPDVTITIKLKRKSFNVFFNLIIPAFVISLLSSLAFLLPPDSEEKMGLSVTVLLALTVFLLLIAESVPPSDSIPLIGKLL